jgi:hypothetical protein
MMNPNDDTRGRCKNAWTNKWAWRLFTTLTSQPP